MDVVIIDYGSSNLFSIKKAFTECGASVRISNNPDDFEHASHIVLPGVGSFYDSMINLRKKKFDKYIVKIVLEKKIPILGICLGMQLFADKGCEGGETEGLGLIAGEVKILKPVNLSEKIPHVGWNEIHIRNKNSLITDIPNKTDFYFVHSYHLAVKNTADVIATTPYCRSFVSIVRHDNIFGVQFHPEKSQHWGFKIITNFINYN